MADLRAALRGDFPRRLVPAAFDKDRYSHDAGLQWEEPLAVAFPRSEEDVQALVRWCARRDVPVTPRGAGSSIAGNAFGPGLVLDFARMVRVLAEGPGWVRAEPGVVLAALNRRLARAGRRIGPSPSSEAFCTLGGMVGNNAAGSHGLRYGATVDNVRALRFVAADGEVHAWSGPQRRPRGPWQQALADVAMGFRSPWPGVAKNSSGYLLDKLGRPGAWHFQRVLVGSEGTLGVVTQVTLRTHPVPEAAATVLFAFATSEEALAAVPALLPARPAALELVDEAALGVLLPRHRGLPAIVRRAGCCLVLDLFGSAANVRRRARVLAARAASLRAQACAVAVRPSDRARLWAARRDVEPLLRALPGRRRPLPFIEDVAVPVAVLPEYVRRLRSVLGAEGLDAPLYGHAGQGNLHIRPFLDPRSAADRARLQRVNVRVARLARSLGGTLTGEHGDGHLRTRLLRRLAPRAYRDFVRVKRLFDPFDLLNPGKVVATRRSEVAPRLFLGGPRYEPPRRA